MELRLIKIELCKLRQIRSSAGYIYQGVYTDNIPDPGSRSYILVTYSKRLREGDINYSLDKYIMTNGDKFWFVIYLSTGDGSIFIRDVQVDTEEELEFAKNEIKEWANGQV